MSTRLRLSWALLSAGVLTLVAAGTAARAQAPTTAPKPSSEFAKMNSAYWDDWKQFQASDQFKGLDRAAGNAKHIEAAVGAARKAGMQGIVDVAIAKPAEAAKLMSAAATASKGSANQAALETVLNMRTTPKVRDAAVPLVAPEARPQVEAFRANLSTGIPGLPGIYLSHQAEKRAAAPAGYSSVKGTSLGCRGR